MYMRKNDKGFLQIMKKYGPGFVALSKRSGKVVASGRDIKQLWKKAEEQHVDFSKIVITHIPKYGTVSLYFMHER